MCIRDSSVGVPWSWMLPIVEQPGRPPTSRPTRQGCPPVGLPARFGSGARVPTRAGGIWRALQGCRGCPAAACRGAHPYRVAGREGKANRGERAPRNQL
eukprot:1503881-Pyramimonas_sp.AAC.1